MGEINTPTPPTSHTMLRQHLCYQKPGSAKGSLSHIGQDEAKIPICRDFLKNRCARVICNYQHKIPEPDSGISDGLKEKPTQIFNNMLIPGKGSCFISLSSFLEQTAFNGLFICNLADIIPISIITRLLTYSVLHKRTLLDELNILAGEWADKLNNIIKWNHQSTPNFNKLNYGLIFVFDISTAVSEWVAKLGYNTINQNATKVIGRQENKLDILTNQILDCLNQLFTILFSQPSNDHNGFPLAKMNIIVNYMNDELNYINKGLLEMLFGMITLSQNKYIGTQFYTNIYYIGLPPNLEMPISSSENQGFIFCYITGTKFINLAMIYTNGNDITYLGDIEIGQNIISYNSQLSDHNTQVYKILFEKNEKLKSALNNAIPIDNIRPKSLVVIGCNLDIEFDKQLLTGLTEVVGSIDYTFIANNRAGAPNKVSNSKTHSVVPNSSEKIKNITKLIGSNDCCGDNPATGITMSIILPILSGNPSTNSNPNSGNDSGSNKNITKNNTGGSSVHNYFNTTEMIQELLGGGRTNTILGTTHKIIENKVCSIGLNLIYSATGGLSLNQPLSTVPGIEKIKEYGQSPDNKIIIICSSRLTHSFFQEIVSQLIKLPGYTNKISANFIDFNINPSIRSCLAYHNYRHRIQKNYGNLGKLVCCADNLLIKNTKLWRRLKSYISDINPHFINKDITEFRKHTPPLPTNNGSQCCSCCACISRNGIGYNKFGNFPFVPKCILDSIKDDSWLPRF